MSEELEKTLGNEQRLAYEGDAISDEQGLEEVLGDMDSYFDVEDEEPTTQDEPTEGEEPDEEADEEEVDEEEDAEDADAEDDDQPDEEADEEGEDDEDEDEDADDDVYHSLKIDGEEFEVTLQEALDGYSRTQDYTRKRQANEEAHREVMASVKDQSSEYVEKLDYLSQVISQMSPKEKTSAEWQALQDSDPVKFATEFAEAQFLKQKTDAIAVERGIEMEAVIAEQGAEYERHLGEQRDALLVAIPEWKDDDVSEKERGDLKAFAMEEFGYTADDLGMVADHRLMVILHDSMKLRKGQKAGVEKIRAKKKGTKRLRPGKGKARNTGIRKSKAHLAAVEKLARSGSEQDALTVLEGMDL